MQFWIILAILCTVSFTAALESTIITTALPQISESVNGADTHYIWISSSFILCSTVFQPLYGHLSDILGRRAPYLTALSIFALGAGICGGSSTVAALIAGRTVQGIGSAGMFVVSDLIICDLVPLRQRSKYMGAILAVAAFGAVLGPIAGGALVMADWRWCFYIDLVMAGPCLVQITGFSRLNHMRGSSWMSALARVDIIGNVVFVLSMVSLLLGLVIGGSSTIPWVSWRVLLPLMLGISGWAAFHIWESSRFCERPTLPTYLFANRTTSTALFLTLLAGSLCNWSAYFFSFYF